MPSQKKKKKKKSRFQLLLLLLSFMQASLTRHFPYTEEGFLEFEYNKLGRQRDAHELYPDVTKRVCRIILLQKAAIG